MAGRGVHFALTEEQEKQVLLIQSNKELLNFIQEEIEEEWNEEFLQETDKAWDGIHRCLTDGTLNFESGLYSLNKVIMGGKQLYDEEDYIVSYVSGSEIHDIAKTIKTLEEDWFRERFFQIDNKDYHGGQDWNFTEEDFEHHWEHLKSLKEFFQTASNNNRAVIFTVDQ